MGWRDGEEIGRAKQENFMFRQSSFSNLIVDRYIVFIKLRISNTYEAPNIILSIS